MPDFKRYSLKDTFHNPFLILTKWSLLVSLIILIALSFTKGVVDGERPLIELAIASLSEI